MSVREGLEKTLTQARMRNPAHNGLAEGIRKELTERPSATATAVAYRLGQDPSRVKSAIQQLCNVTGGIAAVPWSPARAREYATVDWIRREERKRAEAARRANASGLCVAGRIVIRGYRYGWGRLA